MHFRISPFFQTVYSLFQNFNVHIHVKRFINEMVVDNLRATEMHFTKMNWLSEILNT
jgi:hypothetical protein